MRPLRRKAITPHNRLIQQIRKDQSDLVPVPEGSETREIPGDCTVLEHEPKGFPDEIHRRLYEPRTADEPDRVSAYLDVSGIFAAITGATRG